MSSRSDRRRAVPGAARTGEVQDLGAVLDGLLRGRPWTAGLAVGELARRWVEVVGERLAEECRPERLEGDVLFVMASSAAWAAQIGFLAQDVVRGAGEVAKVPVRSIRVLVDPEGGSAGPHRRGDVGGGR